MMQIIVTAQDNQLNSSELCLCSEINEAILHELVEHSIAVPLLGEQLTEWRFTVETVILVKKAARIQRDLSVDWSAIPLVLQLLNERDELELENSMLKQQLERFKEFD